MKNTKFILKTSKSNIPIDQDEVIKVVEALRSSEVKVLRRGVFNPSFFDSIVEDEAYMASYRENNKFSIRDGEIKAFPEYKDLFAELRASIKALPQIWKAPGGSTPV